MSTLELEPVKETAKLLKMPERRVRSLIRTGVLPGVKLGGEWRVDVGRLREQLASATDRKG